MNMQDYNKIPTDSLVHHYLPVNYYDVIGYTFLGENDITPDEIQKSFWTSMPKWVDNLFKLRNWLVKPFGLKTDKGEVQKTRECIENGGSEGMMSVPAKSERETVISLNDKHLIAYLSIYIEKHESNKTTVKSITLVKFHSWLGYVYFYTILPFHYIVVKQILKYTVNKIIESKKE